jgi:hypothetical protein
MKKMLSFTTISLALSLSITTACWSMEEDLPQQNLRGTVRYLEKPATTPYTQPLIATMVAEYHDMFAPYGLALDRTTLFKQENGKNILVADEKSLIEAIKTLHLFLLQVKDAQQGSLKILKDKMTENTEKDSQDIIQNIGKQLIDCRNHLQHLQTISQGASGIHLLDLPNTLIPRAIREQMIPSLLNAKDIKNLVDTLPEKVRKDAPLKEEQKKTFEEQWEKRKQDFQSQVQQGTGNLGSIYQAKDYGPYLSAQPSKENNVTLHDIAQVIKFLSGNTLEENTIFEELLSKKEEVRPDLNIKYELREDLQKATEQTSFSSRTAYIQKLGNGYCIFACSLDEVMWNYRQEINDLFSDNEVVQKLRKLLEPKLQFLKEAFPKMRFITLQEAQMLPCDPNLPNNLFVIVDNYRQNALWFFISPSK